jgi:hypothetical protein
MLVTTTLSAKGTVMAETQIRFEDGLSYERYMEIGAGE